MDIDVARIEADLSGHRVPPHLDVGGVFAGEI
jgi:hypothetical protein